MLLTSPGIAVPPEATVYQLYCPLVPPEAFSVTALAGQALAPVAVGGGVIVRVAVTSVRVLSQPLVFSET